MNIYKYLLLLVPFLFSKQECYSQKNKILDTVINEIKLNSIYKAKVNWDKFIPELYNSINPEASDSINSILPAIEKLYTKLEDYHGLFSYKGRIIKAIYESRQSTNNDSTIYKYALDEKYAFRTKIIQNKYGYLAVPSIQLPIEDFMDQESICKKVSEMAQRLQDSLNVLSSNQLKGIIIDLRLNLGGTYSIIISGLSSLLGNGTIFSIIKGNSSSIILKNIDNHIYQGDELISVTKKEHDFKKIKIAILIGPFVSSAGEQAALAFKGTDNTIFIGEKTKGFASMTELVKLSKDLFYTYSTAFIKDNKGLCYETFVSPDLEIKGGDNYEDISNDSKVKAALKWFKAVER
ncbi:MULTISPECIES: S41 family peptidase [Sphingobacterium]|uniref:S41 family peptidase n=1 Tax=Sphingobacterium TaxID=28453 RepID=UPI00257C4CC8|nr:MULTISPECIES: S41 family peptidase [Sphingobacterium]